MLTHGGGLVSWQRMAPPHNGQSITWVSLWRGAMPCEALFRSLSRLAASMRRPMVVKTFLHPSSLVVADQREAPRRPSFFHSL